MRLLSEVVLSIDQLPPMKNHLRGRHWSVAYESKRQWSWLLIAAVSIESRATLREWAKQNLRVVIDTEIETKKLFDEDNLSSAGNICLDALKWAQFIVDDDPAHVEYSKPVQRKAKKAKIILRIRPASL